MKKLLTTIAAIAFMSAACASDRVSCLISITDLPVTGDDLTINGTVIYWTNTISASCIETNTNTLSSATNLWTQFVTYPIAGPMTLAWSSPTGITVKAQPGNPLVIEQTGDWCELTHSTQTVTTAYTVRVPHTAEPTAWVRTNIASMLVTYIDSVATNAFATNANALTNYVTTGPTTQYISGEKVFLSLAGGVNRLTNGYATNTTLDKPIMTNINVYGGLRSHGAGTGSDVFGNSASAPGDNAIAIGQGTATGEKAIAIGHTAAGDQNFSIAIGPDTTADQDSIAIGDVVSAQATNAVAIGPSTSANYNNSTALGSGATCTASNQVMLGASTYTAVIPGLLSAAKQTNSTLSGTNAITGCLVMPMQTIDSIADGNNTIAIPDSATYVYLSGAPSAQWTNCSMSGTKYGGRLILVENNTGQDMVIAHESGFDGTAANRLATKDAANLVLTGRAACWFVYNATSARWIMISPYD